MYKLNAISLWTKLLCFAASAMVLLSLVSLAAFYYLSLPTGKSQAREVQIKPGMSARQIGEHLERRGLVHSARIFAWTVQWQGLSQSLKAGTYQLDGTKDTAGIIQDLLKAPIQTRRVTFPEGLTRRQTAQILQRHGLIDSARFLTLTEDARLIRQLQLHAPTLEGYLFPETYFFDLETTEEAVIERMVGEFHRVFSDSLKRRLKDLDLTLHQAVTLASIIELEAVVDDERPIISAVFHRRLKFNRRLESCATVEYALGVHKKRLTTADLKVKSPYNTYRHRGLPPAPIGNPGLASLLACLYPAETDYLYFVARGNGRHVFSRTNREHELAKRQIRREQRRAQLEQLN